MIEPYFEPSAPITVGFVLAMLKYCAWGMAVASVLGGLLKFAVSRESSPRRIEPRPPAPKTDWSPFERDLLNRIGQGAPLPPYRHPAPRRELTAEQRALHRRIERMEGWD
jgi:hypothetical protein